MFGFFCFFFLSSSQDNVGFLHSWLDQGGIEIWNQWKHYKSLRAEAMSLVALSDRLYFEYERSGRCKKSHLSIYD